MQNKICENGDNDVLSKFGNNLRRIRILRGLSQERLALENDFNRTYVSLLERGQRNPSLKTMNKLASFLDVKVAVLLEGI